MPLAILMLTLLLLLLLLLALLYSAPSGLSRALRVQLVPQLAVLCRAAIVQLPTSADARCSELLELLPWCTKLLL
jgi:hypothetical protein